MGTWVARGLLTGLFLFVSSCSTLGPDTQASTASRAADHLVTEAEALHVNCELNRQRAGAAWEALLVLVGRPWPRGPQAAYEDLAREVARLEQEVQRLDRRATAWERATPAFFRSWSLRTAELGSEELRLVAEARRARSERVAADAAQALGVAHADLARTCDALRDLVTFLEHDFNDGSLSIAEGEARSLRPHLQRSVQDLLRAEEHLRVFVRRTAPQIEAEVTLLERERAASEAR